VKQKLVDQSVDLGLWSRWNYISISETHP